VVGVVHPVGITVRGHQPNARPFGWTPGAGGDGVPVGPIWGRVQCDVGPDLDVPACCHGERGSFVGDVGSLVLQLFSAGGDLGSATLHAREFDEATLVPVNEAALLGVAPVLRVWP
jgi:hypothetical protein